MRIRSVCFFNIKVVQLCLREWRMICAQLLCDLSPSRSGQKQKLQPENAKLLEQAAINFRRSVQKVDTERAQKDIYFSLLRHPVQKVYYTLLKFLLYHFSRAPLCTFCYRFDIFIFLR
jgi:hypothetical protein